MQTSSKTIFSTPQTVRENPFVQKIPTRTDAPASLGLRAAAFLVDYILTLLILGVAISVAMIFKSAFPTVANWIINLGYVAAIGFVIWSMGSSDSNSNTVAIKKTITPLPVVSKPTNPIGAQSATNANSIGRQSATNANLIKVRVETNEGSAQVFRDAQIVGNTPFDVIGSEGETVKLTLKREGFEDQVVSIDITGRRGVFTFSLKRKQ